MSIDKPEIPSVELPETWGGTQTPYNESQIANGYEEAVPQIVDGGNVNYEKRGLFENVKYLRTVADSIVNMPIGKVLTVDDNNKLAYETQIRDDTVVHRDGEETITGQKTFEQSIIQKMEFAYTEAPSSTRFFGLALKDKNRENWGSFEGIKYNSGTNCVQMTVMGNSGTLSRMYVQENANGNVTYSFGQTSGTYWIKIPKGAGTAVLICWGNISSAQMETSKTITYPTAFSDSPRISLTSNGGSAQVYQNVIKDVSSTGFTAIASGGSASQGFHWIAVGNAKI